MALCYLNQDQLTPEFEEASLDVSLNRLLDAYSPSISIGGRGMKLKRGRQWDIQFDKRKKKKGGSWIDFSV